MKKNQISNAVAVKSSYAPATLHETTTSLIVEQFISESDVSTLTAKSYRCAAKIFTGWLEAHGHEISEGALIDYRKWLTANRAATSARLYFTIAKKLTGWLARRGYIQRDFSYGVKTIKVDTGVHRRDALTPTEIAECLSTFEGDTAKVLRDRAIFALMAATGLRCVEVIRLDVGDIEKRGGQWTLRVHGKARAGKLDTIILPTEVKSLIDKYLASAKRARVSNSEPLFTSLSNRNRRQRLDVQTVSKLCKSTFRRAGIVSARITAHSLRHSAATIALDNGVDLDSVALNLRHKSTAVTQIYRHDAAVIRNKANLIVASVISAAVAELIKLKGADSIGNKAKTNQPARE